MSNSSAQIPARIALAGNPSDGYGGAVVSTLLPRFSATATIERHGPGEPIPIVSAVIERCAHEFGIDPGIGVVVESTIPRSVGLAGSSAIAIATIRALDAEFSLGLSAHTVATIAYLVEREDLQIAGGWQDQIIQAYGVTGLMEFAEPISHRALNVPTEPPIPMFLAWRSSDSEPSGLSHAELQSRRDTPELIHIMNDLAEVARSAATAIEQRNIHDLKQAIGRTFALRSSVMDISDRHRRVVECAAEYGAIANFAGSGGAVVGVMPKEREVLLEGMRSDAYDVVEFGLGTT